MKLLFVGCRVVVCSHGKVFVPAWSYLLDKKLLFVPVELLFPCEFVCSDVV